MLRGVKHTYFAASSRYAVARFVGRSEWRRRRLLIVGWHGIARYDEHHWNPHLYLAPETFRRRLAILRKAGCTVLGLEDALGRLAHETLPDRAVVLTFDDGYVDFLTTVWPALKEEGFPGTVYLTTQRCIHNRPAVPLLLSYLLWRHQPAGLDGRGILGLEARQYALGSLAERRVVQTAIEGAMKSLRLNPRDKDDVVVDVAARLGADHREYAERRVLALMNPDEVEMVARDGADVQLHTHNHSPSTDAATFRKEIIKNRLLIEDMTGRPARHFCYPSGLYERWHVPVLEETKVWSASTCDPALASSRSSPHLLPRLIDTDHVTDVEFENWVLGTAGLLPHRARSLPVAAPGADVTAASEELELGPIEHVPEGTW
jgi:peptidoglycan/xylan/chitin deacetylase (PgdA/CDA1 family)